MIVGRTEFLHHKNKFLKQIIDGAVFIYPTDTVYAIGCDARNNKSVLRVRALKNRNVMPISIVAPNVEWIREHLVADEEWLARLPGPYTLAFLIKEDRCIAPAVTMGRDNLGVRIPSHWIHDIVAELGFPIIGTSANKTGQNVMTKLDDLPSVLNAIISVAKKCLSAARKLQAKSKTKGS